MDSEVTLNSFLRKLPELTVDNMTFVRGNYLSEFYVENGSWKFRKSGYNNYVVRKLVGPTYEHAAEWDSSKGAGDVFIKSIQLSLTGVRVTLGEDVLDERNY